MTDAAEAERLRLELAELAAIRDRVSTWGKWGPGDEKGALNYITPAKRLQAAHSVRHGIVHSLSLPFGAGGPQVPAPQLPGSPWRPPSTRDNPKHVMIATGSDPDSVNGLGGGAHYTDDMIMMELQSSTQWDALSHNYYEGRLYNGHPAMSVDSAGASVLSIDKVAAEFVSRGVLLDIPRLLGVDELEAAHEVSAAELEAAAEREGVVVSSGDIVLVRTGLLHDWAETRSYANVTRRPQPGLGVDCLEWLTTREVAALAADNTAVEMLGHGRELKGPFHMLALRDAGLHLGEYWFLEELAADCARLGQHDFLLSAQALPFEKAVGSPVNPIAML